MMSYIFKTLLVIPSHKPLETALTNLEIDTHRGSSSWTNDGSTLKCCTLPQKIIFEGGGAVGKMLLHPTNINSRIIHFYVQI